MSNGDEKSGEIVRLIKFDGDEKNWHEWSVKTLALAKTKGFRGVYAKDTKPCNDEAYEKTGTGAATKEQKAIYEANDKAYQLLVMSCSGIAFGLVNQAKTKSHADGDAFMAWKNLSDRYAPHGVSDLIQLTGEFNACALTSNKDDPDEWFIKLDLIHHKIAAIDATYEKKEIELVAHIIDKLPSGYSEIITVVEGMSTIALPELKQKIRAFYKRKFKGESKDNELALAVYTKFKGDCRNCGKQGHKAADCRSKNKNAGPNKDKDNKKKLKCFNCNKYAGHISKDCPDKKRDADSAVKETGMFVGCCVEINDSNDSNEQHYVGYSPAAKSEFCASSDGTEKWLADTGATTHISMSDRHMTNAEDVSIKVIVGDGNEVLCTKRGDVTISDGKNKMLLQRVLHAPSFHKNIVSVGLFVANHKHTVEMNSKTLKIHNDERNELTFQRDDAGVLYYFKGFRVNPTMKPPVLSNREHCLTYESSPNNR